MTRKDLMELKRRLKKEECTFTRMSGCYVDGNRRKVVTFAESFLTLPDEEFFKYLEIAKKALSGTVGNNQLYLSFPSEEEGTGGKQQFFMGLNKSGLKDEGLLERFYDLVIEHYDYTGNFLILLFHDAYDIPLRTSDNRKLDESTEVFEYTLCAICPVTLSKPGLGYIEEENKIGLRLRDWVVSPPENGFVFPAFSERSADIHGLSYYVKNAKDPKPGFMEKCLGVGKKRTSTQQKKAFENVVKTAVMGTEHEDHAQEIFLALQEEICDRVEEAQARGEEDGLALDSASFNGLMEACELDAYLMPRLTAAFEEEFGEENPAADAVLDTKALAKSRPKKLQEELQNEVDSLRASLSHLQQNGAALPDADLTAAPFDEGPDEENAAGLPDPEEALSGAPAAKLGEHALLCDIFLRVKPEKANRITTKQIDGQRCLVIPVNEGDDIDINGLKTLPTTS